jgi:DNA-binding transcriptional MerR regulator
MEQAKGALVKITELSTRLDLSSRSLRYYEQIGLIQSIRFPFEKYRYYTTETIERLKQIMVLRKMQIPIKDIIRIYESEDIRVVVETFVNRIHAIDNEIGALTELKRIIGEFLQIMQKNGINKISAIPLFYEEIEKQFDLSELHKPISYESLSNLSELLAKPVDPSIIALPGMRVVSSLLKDNPEESDVDGFWRWLQECNLLTGTSGQHERFEYQTNTGDVILQRIPENFENNSKYLDFIFRGGLFASVNVYLDDDLAEWLKSAVKYFDNNKFYMIDYSHSGELRHPVMLESLISPDEKRELVALLLPVKKRMADPTLFDTPDEITNISIQEIEEDNPILWEMDLPLDHLTQTHTNNSYFRINEEGEAEYIAWINRAVLHTHVSVRLPFRIDMEFRQSGQGKTGIVFYHGEDTGYQAGSDIGGRGFAINWGNDNDKMVQAIHFHQPIFRDSFHFPGRGAIRKDELNRLTWIVGEKQLAVIINDEIRYCGVKFPYMSLNLSCETALPIVIGTQGNDRVYFRSIRISQLAGTQKNKMKRGELTMITKQSNNIIPIIHRLVTDEYGENYWFNGCARYVMECLGEKDYDYWFFAGITGDLFTQHYPHTKYTGDALSSYMMQEKPSEYVEEIFAKCGYSATFVSKTELNKNTKMYLQTLIAYIDKGIPVIMWANWSGVGVFVGYEECGNVLLYISGNNNEPERIPLEKALEMKPNPEAVDNCMKGNPDEEGWIFVGDKKEDRPLSVIYREAIRSIPRYSKRKTASYCFGAEAFRAWASDIEQGKFDHMIVEEFDTWAYYTNYLCVLATNGSCCYGFLNKAQELNPDFTWLDEIKGLYYRMGLLWNNNNGNDLEALGGGFNVTLEVLQDKEKRTKIAELIRKCGDYMDEAVRIINENIK